VITHIWEATTAKRIKIDPIKPRNILRMRCIALSVDDYLVLKKCRFEIFDIIAFWNGSAI